MTEAVEVGPATGSSRNGAAPANGPLLGARFQQALVDAARLHIAQHRKGGSAPYLSHLLGVAGLVIGDGGDENEAIAALFHDAVEDQGGRPVLERIRVEYGDDVADIVAACTESFWQPKPPWRERKEGYLQGLETAPARVLRVALADKLENLRAIVTDYAIVGDDVWKRFNAGRDQQLWYYGALVDLFRRRCEGRPLTRALGREYRTLRVAVERTAQAGVITAPTPPPVARPVSSVAVGTAVTAPLPSPRTVTAPRPTAAAPKSPPLTRGQGGRAAPEPPHIIAIDWSGDASSAARQRMWSAQVSASGELLDLGNGRTRREVTDLLLSLKSTHESVVVGFDFAFSLPAWFMRREGFDTVEELWRSNRLEGWLRDCPEPFWGRPGVRRPQHGNPVLRRTDQAIPAVAGTQPKSVFQLGGAGTVGSGSLRGFPVLAILRRQGFAIWPFDPPGRHTIVEIYPRSLTGRVRKSDALARAAYLEREHWPVSTEARARAASSEDAFDAAVSARIMAAHAGDFAALRAATDPDVLLEGWIWDPGAPLP